MNGDIFKYNINIEFYLLSSMESSRVLFHLKSKSTQLNKSYILKDPIFNIQRLAQINKPPDNTNVSHHDMLDTNVPTTVTSYPDSSYLGKCKDVISNENKVLNGILIHSNSPNNIKRDPFTVKLSCGLPMMNIIRNKGMFWINSKGQKIIAKNIKYKKHINTNMLPNIVIKNNIDNIEFTHKISKNNILLNTTCDQISENEDTIDNMSDETPIDLIKVNMYERKSIISSIITNNTNKDIEQMDSTIYNILNRITYSGGELIVKKEVIFNLIPRITLQLKIC